MVDLPNVPEPIAEGVAVAPTPPVGSSPWAEVGRVVAWTGRWLALGMGMGVMWGVGVGLAQVWPHRQAEMPWQEATLRRTQRLSQRLRQLPTWWASTAPESPPGVSPPPLEPSPPPAAAPTVTLTPEQRQQLETELAAVQGELQRLRDRASALEVQLGIPRLATSLEERLSRVGNQLLPATPQPPVSPPTPPTAREADTAVLVTPPPLVPPVLAYRVTLPSDVLFVPGDALLREGATALLESILTDVGRFPGATIVVGSYSDGEGTGADRAAVTFQQAIAVQRYLSERLGVESYRWLAVGYGRQPLGVGAAGTALPRRIAISIIPPP